MNSIASHSVYREIVAAIFRRFCRLTRVIAQQLHMVFPSSTLK